MPFAAAVWAVHVGVVVLGWALEWRVADALAPIAGLLSRVYDTSLLGPLGIRHLAWTLALAVGGWHVLRARMARGASEVAATFVIAAVGTFIVGDPGGYLEGSIELARNSSGAVTEAVSGAVAQDTEADDTDMLATALYRSFVAEPYDVVNWGERLSGACAEAREEILAEGPWGADGEPREIMRKAGCDKQADYNEEPTGERAMGSLLVAIAAVVTVLLILAVALGLLFAQLTLVFLFASASIVWAVALFPGLGRGALFWWLRKLGWAILAAVATTFLMSWLAITITVVLAAMTDIGVIERCLVVLLISIFAWKIRGQLNRIAEALPHRVRDHLSGVVPSRPLPLSPAGTGGLRSMTRQIATDLPGGQWATYRLDARRFGRRRYGGGLLGGRHHARGPGRTVRRLGNSTVDTVRRTKGDIRAVGRGARAAALAPVLAPRAYERTYLQATDTTRRARSRLAQARDTHRQWVHNARHPVETMRAAHEHARHQAANRARRTATTTSRPRRRPPQRRQRPTVEDMEWM